MYIESEILELKEKFTEALVRDMVAFLNTNGGEIIIGVKDDGKIIGIPLSQLDEVERKISDIITDQIEPSAQSEISSEVSEEEGKTLIRVKVMKGYRPIYCLKKYGFSSKGCLLRIGASCKEMDNGEISRRYRQSIIGNDAILEAPSHYSPISFNMMKVLLIGQGSHIVESSFEATFNLRRQDGRYNLMAELLSDHNMVPLIFAKFAGTTKASLSQRSDYGSQSILLAYQRMKDRLIAENICRTDTSVRPRIDEYLYDMDCVNEVLVNAIVHNDWTISEPLVSFFSDRLEITSHGGLPKEITREEFFEGVSHPRNTVLMRIFLKLGIVEHTGHGIPRIVERYGREVFSIHDSFINVVIPFNESVMKEMHVSNVGKEFDTELSDKERKVLLDIIEKDEISYDGLVKELGISRRTVSRVFSSLVEKGYIERVGTNKKGYWKVLR